MLLLYPNSASFCAPCSVAEARPHQRVVFGRFDCSHRDKNHRLSPFVGQSRCKNRTCTSSSVFSVSSTVITARCVQMPSTTACTSPWPNNRCFTRPPRRFAYYPLRAGSPHVVHALFRSRKSSLLVARAGSKPGVWRNLYQGRPVSSPQTLGSCLLLYAELRIPRFLHEKVQVFGIRETVSFLELWKTKDGPLKSARSWASTWYMAQHGT